MFDSLTQRSQPPVAYMHRLSVFCAGASRRLRDLAECVKSDSARDRMRRKAERIADLDQSMRLGRD